MAVEAKRARLDSVPDDIGQLNAERELANVLERLLNVGGDESGLDELLDELGRAQASLDGSKQAHLAFQAIADAQQKLQVGGSRWCPVLQGVASSIIRSGMAEPPRLPQFELQTLWELPARHMLHTAHSAASPAL